MNKKPLVAGILIFIATSIFVGRQYEYVRSRSEVIGRWSGMAYPPIGKGPAKILLEILDDGTYREDDLQGHWSIRGQVLTLTPKMGRQWTLQLTEDGRLTDGLVDGDSFVKE